ncbi:unnamed protein product [Adineta ricciae]|uniref:Uncharacterized protein n=1 Tax=Adineta ricciae TaxID=249248 RepID=A0A814TEG9_ADIRI|nr:unnamed protein product [Adineta ricciae]
MQPSLYSPFAFGFGMCLPVDIHCVTDTLRNISIIASGHVCIGWTKKKNNNNDDDRKPAATSRNRMNKDTYSIHRA